jgi:hypothetical protein
VNHLIISDFGFQSEIIAGADLQSVPRYYVRNHRWRGFAIRARIFNTNYGTDYKSAPANVFFKSEINPPQSAIFKILFVMFIFDLEKIR